MGCSKTTKNKAKDSSGGLMANFIRESGEKGRDTVWVCGHLPKAIAIWVNGKKGLLKVRVFINHLIAKNIRELSRTSSNTVLAKSLSQMEIDIKDSMYRV